MGKTRIFTRFRDIGVDREDAANPLDFGPVHLVRQGKSKPEVITRTGNTTSTTFINTTREEEEEGGGGVDGDSSGEGEGEGVGEGDVDDDSLIYRQTIGLSLCVYTPQYPRSPRAIRTEVWDSSGR